MVELSSPVSPSIPLLDSARVGLTVQFEAEEGRLHSVNPICLGIASNKRLDTETFAARRCPLILHYGTP